MKNINTMKHAGIIIAVMFLLPFLVTPSFAQKTKVNPYSEKDSKSKEDPNNQKKRRTSYENFELTEDNLEWAKQEIKKEKENADADLEAGRITVDEYEERMSKIAKAERKVREFEIKGSEIPKKDDDDPSSVNNEVDKTGGEFVSKKDLDEQKRNARAERDKQRREANKAKTNKDREKRTKDRLDQEKAKLEKERKEGKITDKEYNERMNRLLQAEENMKNREAAAEKQEKETKEKKETSDVTNNDRENNQEADQQENEQERKKQANKTKYQKEVELEDSVKTGDVKLAAAKEKLQREKEKLEREKKNGKVSEQQYQARTRKIERVEEAISDLEEKVKKGKNIK